MDATQFDALLGGQTLNLGNSSQYVTPAAASAAVPVNVSSGFDPGSVTPGASSWDQVLQYGLTRWIDAKTTPAPPQNAQATMTPAYASMLGASGAAGILPWLLIGLVVWAVVRAKA